MNHLSNQTINSMTSGQVIIDLSGAVKELLENSLDAGASRIEINLTEFGTESIAVIDNASGIEEENHCKFGQRNSTSKISSFEEIDLTDTFGFRGEAISSLCSLSSLEVSTCTTPPLGFKLYYDRMGCLTKSVRAARSKGTTVTVIRLFSTLPVRYQEFKRTSKKQWFECIDLVRAYCLAHPTVRFSMSNKPSKGIKTIALDSSGTGTTRSVLTSLYGASLTNLIDIDKEMTVEEEKEAWCVNLKGVISKPKHMCGRADNTRQYFFINGKPIDVPRLAKVINQIYKEFNSLQYPVVALFLTLPSSRFDRNLTPDKRTLILQAEDVLLSVLKDALKDSFDPYRGEFSSALKPNPYASSKVHIAVCTSNGNVAKSIPNTLRLPMVAPIIDTIPFKPSMSIDHNSIVVVDWKVLDSVEEKSDYTFSDGNLETPIFIHKEDFKSMKVIGQFNLGFILVSFDEYLFIVDQHASDEKYLYEKFRTERVTVQPLIRYLLHIIQSSKLLFTTPQQDSILLDYQFRLKERGFDLVKKEEEWYMAGIPHLRNAAFELDDIEEILALLADRPSDIPLCKKMRWNIASKACRAATMIGDALDHAKMKSILLNMGYLEQPWSCPHGRPTIRLLTRIARSH